MQFEEVKELIAIFEQSDLNDMEVQLDNALVRLNRGIAPALSGETTVVEKAKASVVSPPSSAASLTGNVIKEAEKSVVSSAESEEDDSKVIKAPIVGTFYKSPAPDKDAFVKVGDIVSEGDTVCIIEAMKFMNEVNSEVSGTIAEILVEDGEFVEYGQELFRLK